MVWDQYAGMCFYSIWLALGTRLSSTFVISHSTIISPFGFEHPSRADTNGLIDDVDDLISVELPCSGESRAPL